MLTPGMTYTKPMELRLLETEPLSNAAPDDAFAYDPPTLDSVPQNPVSLVGVVEFLHLYYSLPGCYS
jgi:hypothetical protein